MRNEKLLMPEKCLLLVVDVQEAFKVHIPGWEQMVGRIRLMIEAAGLLEVPVVVTEQYPKGLGRTAEPLREVLGTCPVYEKVTFSALDTDAIPQTMAAFHRQQLLLAGIETHVCIAQTALDALASGWQTYVVADATGSRHAIDAETALARLRQAGVILTTVEASILEMTRTSSHPQFRQLSKLIK